MRVESTSRGDSTTAIASPLLCGHGDDVAEVRAEDGFRLYVRFFDGTSGRINMSELIHSPNAGVFGQLSDALVFGQVGVTLGAVTWPNGLDLAPDAMYEALCQDGVWEPR